MPSETRDAGVPFAYPVAVPAGGNTGLSPVADLGAFDYARFQVRVTYSPGAAVAAAVAGYLGDGSGVTLNTQADLVWVVPLTPNQDAYTSFAAPQGQWVFRITNADGANDIAVGMTYDGFVR